jgi:hypothetical protein
MEEQKNFKYAGNVNFMSSKQVDVSQIEIEDVRFLMPVRIDINVNNDVVPVFAKIDLTNKEIYFDLDWLNDESVKQKVFDYLKIKTILPEDHYEADQETYDEVDRANSEENKLRSDKENYD